MAERHGAPWLAGLTTRTTLAFVALVGALLVLPTVLAATGRGPDRGELYKAVPTAAGPYHHFYSEIFLKRGPLDVVFLGSSLTWQAVDAPAVRDALSRSLGRPAEVTVLGANWPGEDLLAVVLDDLLARRPVRTLVLSPPTTTAEIRAMHVQAYRVLDADRARDAARDLPLRAAVAYHAAPVLGLPRALLALVRPAPLDVPVPFAENLGSGLREVGFHGAPFAAASTEPPALRPEDLRFGTASRDRFDFSAPPLTPFQAHQYRRLAARAAAAGTRVVLLRIPQHRERAHPRVVERKGFLELFPPGTPYLGVTPAELFRGKSDREIEAYFYDEHLNANGARLFTRAMLPALLEVADDATTP